MYFFIVFIIATFGLLYVFFKMTQEQEAAMRKDTAKGQRLREQAQVFADVLASPNDDEDRVVNPYAKMTPTQVTSQFTSASTPFVNLAAVSYAKAQQLSLNAQNSVIKAQYGNQVSGHRENRGFGANNLEHLGNEERGRFDNMCTDKKADFSLLSNLSTQPL